MASTYYCTRPVPFGSSDPKPLRRFPSGKIRLRIRKDDFVQAFVRTESCIRHFYVEEVDGFWQPCFEQGANIREESSPWIPARHGRKPTKDDLSPDGKVLARYESGSTDLVGCLFAGSLFFDFDTDPEERIISWMPIP